MWDSLLFIRNFDDALVEKIVQLMIQITPLKSTPFLYTVYIGLYLVSYWDGPYKVTNSPYLLNFFCLEIKNSKYWHQDWFHHKIKYTQAVGRGKQIYF